ncbi:MAG TPA: cyclic nucleotide-binding domain-containing protein [Verrucomicrobiae bacterium]|nr:cyclic nucleotide-binding domain-containing protein [Verrucomicrobiae bacterium]
MTSPLHPDATSWEEGAGEWKSHPFLKDFSPEHLAVLTECAMPSGFAADEVIFREGELANRFYLILGGCVILETQAPDSSWVKVDALSAGDVLGWSWLFVPYVWNFTARATSSVRAVFFYGTWLRERCATDPVFGYELMRRMAGVVVRRLQGTRLQLIRCEGRLRAI